MGIPILVDGGFTLNVTQKSSFHFDDVIMSAIASQITSLTIVYSTVYSGADQRKHESSGSLAFVLGIHREPVNSPHKWPVTRKMFHLMTSSCGWVGMTWRLHGMEAHSALLGLCEGNPIPMEIFLLKARQSQNWWGDIIMTVKHVCISGLTLQSVKDIAKCA